MSPNPAIRCQKERLSARFRICATGRKGGNKSRSVKKRAAELSVWSISPPLHPFSCGKNGISFRKEISFLPQRRKFLAAKTFPSVWKVGKNGASGGFFRLIGDFPRTKSICLFASFPLHGLTRGRHPSARRSAAGGEVSRKAGFRLSSCIPATVRESRIPVRSRPCIRPRDSRGDGFDVLTECHPGFSGGKRMSPAGVSPGGYGIKAS